MKTPLVLAAALLFLPLVLAHGGPVRSPDLKPDESWEYYADDPRVIRYHCHQHMDMWGEIEVTMSGPVMLTVSIVDFAFVPAKATVRYGTSVNWTNDGSVVHSVDENVTHDQHGSTPAGGSSPAPGWALVAIGVVAAAAFAGRRP